MLMLYYIMLRRDLGGGHGHGRGGPGQKGGQWSARQDAASQTSMVNLRSKILDSGGFDSSRILMLRGGILMSMGNFPECLSQSILVGIILVGRLGVGRRIATS